MTWRIVHVRALPGQRREVRFDDGVEGIVDFGRDLWGPVFKPLRDLVKFAEVQLSERGVICWPNGADLAPDAIREELTKGTSAAR